MAWIMLRVIPRNVLPNTNIYSGQRQIVPPPGEVTMPKQQQRLTL